MEWYGFLERVPIRLREGSEAEVAFLVATLFANDRRAYRNSATVSSDASSEAPDTGPDEASGAEPLAANELELGRPAAEHPGRGNFGATLASVCRSGRPEDDAMARRLAILLDSSLEPDGSGTLPWRLRRVSTLVRSREGHINWARLLDDLLDWNHRDRRVQREWARAYYRTAAAADTGSDDTI